MNFRHYRFSEARDPILKPLNTIECRDAILSPDNTEPEWPKTDVVIGNPPFLGDKLLIRHLGNDYVSRLRGTYADRLPAQADLVCYWLEKAGKQIEAGKATRAGLVATNSIRGGANRRALEAATATDTRQIFEAWSNEPWVVDGAAVRVSLICFGSTADKHLARLDGESVEEIYTDLTGRRHGAARIDLTTVRRLCGNSNVAFIGDAKHGTFDVSGDQAREWLRLPTNPNGGTNAEVLKPWMNGKDLTRRPAGKWIIDFG